MALLFIIVAFLLGVPLYLDYKKDPKNNLTVRTINEVSSIPAVDKVLSKIKPHTEKYGVPPLVVLIGGVLLLILIIVLVL